MSAVGSDAQLDATREATAVLMLLCDTGGTATEDCDEDTSAARNPRARCSKRSGTEAVLWSEGDLPPKA